MPSYLTARSLLTSGIALYSFNFLLVFINFIYLARLSSNGWELQYTSFGYLNYFLVDWILFVFPKILSTAIDFVYLSRFSHTLIVFSKSQFALCALSSSIHTQGFPWKPQMRMDTHSFPREYTHTHTPTTIYNPCKIFHGYLNICIPAIVFMSCKFFVVIYHPSPPNSNNHGLA